MVNYKINRTPFSYQQDCIDKMSEEFIKNGRERGMIVVPTGGGKTYITTYWFKENFVDNGYKLLWFCHRNILLKGAYESLKEGLYTINKGIRDSSIIISSQNESWNDVEKNHKYIFSTNQSAVRHLGKLKDTIQTCKKGLVIVIDEAHHSVSWSYTNIINVIYSQAKRNNLDINLIGLTATPSRISSIKDHQLWRMYDSEIDFDTKLKIDNRDFYNSIVYQVSTAQLVKNEVLSVPEIIKYRTEIDFERRFNRRVLERQESKVKKEISDSMLERIAKNSWRNKAIVKEYIKNRKKYGKTIVFAIDIDHCETLKKEFRLNNIAAECVHYDKIGNEEIINNYKNSRTPRVLINVEKLTEGYDAPKTQTVFLTRPTQSKSLAKQMIGRGLRGPRVGGTKKAYLVSFVDTWDVIKPVNIKNDVINRERNQNLLDVDKKQKAISDSQERLSWRQLMLVYKKLRDIMPVKLVQEYKKSPYAWISWVEPIYIYDDENFEIYKEYKEKNIIVYNDQCSHVINLGNWLTQLKKIVEDNNPEFLEEWEPLLSELLDLTFLGTQLNKRIEHYLEDCPGGGGFGRKQIFSIFKALMLEDGEIETYYFVNVDGPEDLAKKYYKQNISSREVKENITELFNENELYEVVYGEEEYFCNEVLAELEKLYSSTPENEIKINKKTIKNNSYHKDYYPYAYNLQILAKVVIFSDKKETIKYPDESFISLNKENIIEQIMKIKKSIPEENKKKMLFNKLYKIRDKKDLLEREDELIFIKDLYNTLIREKEVKEYYKKQNDIIEEYEESFFGLFPNGLPEYKSIRYTNNKSDYWGIFKKTNKEIIINKIFKNPAIPLFVIEYVIYEKLIEIESEKNSYSKEKTNRRLREFIPSLFARRDAYNLNPEYINCQEDNYYWYKQSNYYLKQLRAMYKKTHQKEDVPDIFPEKKGENVKLPIQM